MITIKEKTNFEMVKEFHDKFELKQDPSNLEYQKARIAHMTEELTEYIKAVNSEDREAQLDALVDLVYVALGTAHIDAFEFDKAFECVHTANMQKIRQASDRSKWDVVKPEGWQAPNLKEFI